MRSAPDGIGRDERKDVGSWALESGMGFRAPPAEALSSVQSQATEIARGWSPPGAPASWALTAELFSALAGDDALLAIAAEIPQERMPALLFCAAACYLIGEHAVPELTRCFPSAQEPERPDAAFRPAFARFCMEHRSEILAVCERRRYQMNEVARSTQVALALGEIARRNPAARIALIDLGTGAGLGMNLDRYCYELSDGSRFGDTTSPLVLRCETDGSPPPPVPPALPSIEWRVGIDLDPVDLSDPDDRAWSRSCMPPEHGALERFDRAAQLASVHHCPIIRGDAIEVLPRVLDEAPRHLVPVIVDTYTVVFFSDEERSQLQDLLRERGSIRDAAWISLDPLVPLGTEGRDSVQGLDVPAPLVAEYQQSGVFALLGLVSFEQGRPYRRLLARAHPSGTRVGWLEESGMDGPSHRRPEPGAGLSGHGGAGLSGHGGAGLSGHGGAGLSGHGGAGLSGHGGARGRRPPS